MLRQFFTVASLSVAFAARQEFEYESVLTTASKEWANKGPAPIDEVLDLEVLLKLSPDQASRLESKFWNVSTPNHKDYGNHLTQAQVTEYVAQPESVLSLVSDWLLSGGAISTKVGPHLDSVRVSIKVNDAQVLFASNLTTYEHRERGVMLIRASKAYSIPTTVATHVRMVSGLMQLPSLNAGPIAVEIKADDNEESAIDWPQDCTLCKNHVTPGVISARYSLPPQPTNATKSTLAVSEFQGQVWDQHDLDKFAQSCGLDFNVTVNHENGTISPGTKCKIPIVGTEACGESLLDIEYAKAIAGGSIPLTDVYSSGYNLLTWATQLDAVLDENLPMVMSVSYGNDESQQTSKAFMESANLAFQKLGVRGMSVLFASGDQGACGRSGCVGGKFHPDFPGASPYITTVGGTDFAEKSVIGDEKVWNTGGGGFSNTFPIPSYQADAVAKYKTTAGASLPPASSWNNTGRGYPDVAALAGLQNPYCITAGSANMGIGGTSAACPVVSAIFARLNAVRLASGGKQMGFLNPWIYQNADAFNDVTLGANDGGKKKNGFPATAGWDAASGVGTPNYELMVKAL